jgi:hypothetical protein
VDLRIKLNKPQTRARRLFVDGVTVTLSWGRGVGKSEFILLCMLLLVAAWDRVKRRDDLSGVRIVYLLPAATQARKTVLSRLDAKLQGQFAFLGGSLNHTSLRVEFPGGSYIQLVSAEQGKLNRGIRCDAIFTDEADDVDREFYAAVVSPWLSEPWSLKRRMLGGTPTRGRHGLLYQTHSLGLDGVPGFHTVHATYRDAPEHVDRELVERERVALQRAGLMATFEREWECNFDAGEGLVYPMFAPDFHVREPIATTQWNEILVGVDHGYEDPGVFLVLGVAGSGRDATVHILEEVYRNKQVETWWLAEAAKLRDRYPRHRPKWYVDPSRPDRIQALRNIGLSCYEADNAIEPGLAAVADRMAIRATDDNGPSYSRLYVSPSCKNTIAELGKYRRKKDKKADAFTDEVEDRDNHAMDSLRYAITTRFGRLGGSRRDTSDGSFSFG